MRTAQEGIQLAYGRDPSSLKRKEYGSGGYQIFTCASGSADRSGRKEGHQFIRGKGSF